MIASTLSNRVPGAVQGCPEKRTRLQGCRPAQPDRRNSPSPPLGGRGRGPRSGKVRWAARRTGTSAPLTLPSPPGRRGERENHSRFEPNFAGKPREKAFPRQPCGAMEMSSRPKLRYVSSCMNSRSAPLVAGGTRFVATNSVSGRMNPKSATGARLRPRSDLQASVGQTLFGDVGAARVEVRELGAAPPSCCRAGSSCCASEFRARPSVRHATRRSPLADRPWWRAARPPRRSPPPCRPPVAARSPRLPADALVSRCRTASPLRHLVSA